ncbi:MAG: type VI secretion system membrane subunit TssM [Candidatus Krumholzibacteriota bacterium]|nr:type VI secretion system membrane subunit TssM [Candidatus Krumholzibacteriota bacterium]
MNPLTLILNPRVFLILLMVILMGLVFSLGNRLGLGPLARYLIMAGILLLIVLVVVLWRLRKRRKESETIEHSMIMEAAPPPDAGEEEKRERERAKRELAEAVATLKRSPVAGGGSALAVLPWYLVLGAAESGKSALIRQSGLPFPGTGGEEFQGVSDAVNCEWWFTNQAVILEAKRRFLEAGDEADEDWRTFLGFLGKARPRVPLNGVVVTVAADALMAGEAADLEARAGRLRQRLDAMAEVLELRCPVYLMVSRADRLGGFKAFFDDFESAGRNQVWGATFGRREMGHGDPGVLFDREWQLIMETAHARRVPRMVREADPAARGEVFGFLLELEALGPRLRRFAEVLFQPNPYKQSPLWRGFYLSSAGGGGRAVETVLTEVSRVVGIEQRAAESAAPARPHFLKSFWLNTLIPDWRLARPSARAARRERRQRLALRILGLGVLGLIGVLLIVSFARNLALLNKTREEADKSRQMAVISSRSLPDIEKALSYLDPLRLQLEKLDRWDRRHDIALGMGLYRGHIVNTRAREIYMDRLVDILLAPSRSKLERQLLHEQPHTAADYVAFDGRYRAYRMLINPEHGEPEFLAAQLRALWEDENGATTRSLDLIAAHTTFAWTHPEAVRLRSAVLAGLNADLANRANGYIREHWRPQRYYEIMVADVNEAVPAFDLGEVPGATNLLVTDAARAHGGRAMVPGTFTLRGWRREVKDRILGADQKLQEDWILREAFHDQPVSIRAWLVSEYARNYEAAWNEFLLAVDIATSGGIGGTSPRIWELARSESPFRSLLDEAAANLHFAGDDLAGEEELLEPLADIDEHYAALHGLFSRQGALMQEGKPLDEFLAGLEKVAEQLDVHNNTGEVSTSAASFTRKTFEDPSGEGSAIHASWLWPRRHCQGQGLASCNQAVETLLRRPAQAAWRACLAATGAHLDDLWTKQVWPYWNDNLNNRYPFFSTNDDVSTDEFGRFFGPSGILAEFAGRELAPYLGGDWRPRYLYGHGLAVSDQASNALVRAERFRQALFLAGGDAPAVDFSVEPAQVATVSGRSPYVTQSVLSAGGQILQYDMGRRRSVDFAWPGDRPESPARVAVLTQASAPDPIETQRGPWSLFRLLERATIEKESERKYAVSWELERSGEYRIRVPYTFTARTSANPFQKGFFEFRCPQRLSAGR